MYSIILYFFSLNSEISTLIEITNRNVNSSTASLSLFLSLMYFSTLINTITSAAGYVAGRVYPSITVFEDSGDLRSCVDKGICFATFMKAPFARALKPRHFSNRSCAPHFAPRPARLIRRGVRPYGDEFRNFFA